MGDEDGAAFNHIGLCVTDVEQSRRFYEDALGFAFLYELAPPDEVSGPLLMIEPPVGGTCTFLRLDALILELLHFDRPGNPAARPKPMNQPGLTHLSVSVADVASALERVRTLGGEVLEQTDVGKAVMVRDPDGQLIELLPMEYRRRMRAQGF